MLNKPLGHQSVNREIKVGKGQSMKRKRRTLGVGGEQKLGGPIQSIHLHMYENLTQFIILYDYQMPMK